MSLLAITLILLSAVMHAGWNLFSKSKNPAAAFFLVTSLTGALMLSPVLILYRDVVVHSVPPQVWMFLVATGFFMALYYAALAGAYRAGDMSIAYPIARSSPVIVVFVVALILGRGDQISGFCVVGILLVVGGCILIPLRRFNDLRLRNYLNVTCGLALLAAVGTSGYSMLDDEALRLLRTNPGLTLGNTQLTLLYASLEAIMTSFWLALFVLIRRSGRSSLRRVLRENRRHAVLAGVVIHLTYLIVLISMAFVDNVSYVVGFRQLSIPLGAALGVWVLKEKLYVPKIVGVLVMFVGLILLALG